jgi:hypothetical protein
MADKPHPHEGATYRILELSDGTFAVEVTVPGSHPTKVTGLNDCASAEAWVSRHREQVAAGLPKRSTFRNRKPL